MERGVGYLRDLGCLSFTVMPNRNRQRSAGWLRVREPNGSRNVLKLLVVLHELTEGRYVRLI